MRFERWALTAVVAGALACSASASGGGGGGPINTDGGFSTGERDSGSTTGGGQCSASCALLVPCLGATVGSMGECVSQCQAMGIPASCHSCIQGACNTCGEACGQCFASAACRGMSSSDAGSPTPTTDAGGNPSDPCASATSCGECTGRSVCGWCNGRCYEGTGSGPTGASCGDSPWAWTSSQCSATPPPTDAGSTGGAIGAQCQGCVIGGGCGAAVSACAGDPTCAGCLSNYNNPACGDNPAFINLASCACSSCGSACASECRDFGL